jgi:peptidoglycan hydrolase-like protein with peptidoglycan-binding domain/3D (Asp-Asp-Asp) domain-containing protein
MRLQKTILLWSTALTCAALTATGSALAQTAEGGSDSTTGVQLYPYEQTFIITAYYSPVEGQERYIRGSLAADKKLNGNGTNGADGTPVYPGMIAAPKTIPFGTKMLIPGIGTVAVHDRGGAIVAAGQRGHQYDRLDVWMGYGDEGLNRALRWGRRTVTVVVYGVDDNIVEKIDLSSISSAPSASGSTAAGIAAAPARPVSNDYGYGDENEEITEIKEKLRQLGYFSGSADNHFDQELYGAVLAFQIAQEIVDAENEFGAGYFGPQTRRALEQAWQNKGQGGAATAIPRALAVEDNDTYSEKVLLAGNGLTFLEEDLQLGSSGQAVVELQTELARLNFFGLEPTGYYGEVTAHAVFKFQQSQGMVTDKSSPGAGIFGPQTRERLSSLVNSRIETRRTIAAKPEEHELLASK